MGDLGQHSTAQLIYSNFALLFFFFMIISTYETVFETFLFAGWIRFKIGSRIISLSHSFLSVL